MKSRLLIIEDERPMRTALADALAADGYRILTAENGSIGLEKALREQPDLILLDVMMPRLDGFAVCAELRKLHRHIPILFLTAKGMVQDRVKGLDAGADDYLVKPFSTEELLARVRALLRRARREQSPLHQLQLGDIQINFAAQTMRRILHEKTKSNQPGNPNETSEPLHCTPKEFAVLRLLAEHAGAPVTREQFLDAVWGYAAFPTTRTVDNHIAMLRAKIEPDPENPRFIQTVHGVGYKLANFAIP